MTNRPKTRTNPSDHLSKDKSQRYNHLLMKLTRNRSRKVNRKYSRQGVISVKFIETDRLSMKLERCKAHRPYTHRCAKWGQFIPRELSRVLTSASSLVSLNINKSPVAITFHPFLVRNKRIQKEKQKCMISTKISTPLFKVPHG